MLVKFLLYLQAKYVVKKSRSVAIKAMMIDHRNDVLITLTVFAGIALANLGYFIFDPLVAIIIGLYIIKSGYDISKENIKYLMGDAPKEDIFQKIEKNAESIKGVIGVSGVRAHLLGTSIDVELNIYVDKDINISKAHDIGTKVRKKLEQLPDIQRVNIHIDPFRGKFAKKRKF
jgi:cation diffusion facilitator family transporter